jgi:hypothetical protein
MSVVIADSFAIPALSTLPPFPLTHARIGFETVCTAFNVSASSEAAGFPANAAVTPLTYERWQPELLPAWFKCDAGEAIDVDYVGLAGHNFSDVGAVVTVQHSANDVDWVDFADFSPGDNSPLMFVAATVITARYWRVTISGPGDVPFVGTIYIGTALAMQRPIYGGHSPITLSRKTRTTPNTSDAGQFLGRSTVRKGVATSYSWLNLTAEWYRKYFDPFAKVARENAFFIAWRPATFPSEVGFCWAGDISPDNQGVRNLMSVEISVVGLGD